MPLPSLAPDCAKCDALCCILLAFDASDDFGFDKPACEACKNLTDENQCSIHAGLADQGFKGCVTFDCYGAGQRITQQVFKGRSWREDPSQLPAIDEAFRTLRRLHETVVVLAAAADLNLPSMLEQRRKELLMDLDTGRDWTEAELRSLATGPELRAVRTFLTQLGGMGVVKLNSS